MAAYASLLSLGHILDQLLQHPPRQMAVLDKAQIHSLLKNITFLQDFLEDFSLISGDEIRGLEEKIARSAHAAEDIIEIRVVDQILEDSEAESESSSTRDLQKVIEEFDSMKKDVMKIKKTEGIKIMEQPRKAAAVGSFVRGASDSKNTMVGFDEDLKQIIETLAGDESNLQILPVVGMGEKITQKNDHELGLGLYGSLYHRRCLNVMDDVWSIPDWGAIKSFFPDNNNGSRVMVTTRLSNVADDFRSCTPHQLHFLDEDQSWALFCDKVFGQESCPPELVEIGNNIVRNCRGLPLAIVAISRILARSSQTVEHWEDVANDIYAALNMRGEGHCFEILSLSYKYLPVHLKPCLLYMAR